MSSTTASPAVEIDLPSIPLAELAPWALFFGLLAALALFFAGVEQGALSVFAGTGVHEFLHDGRHLLAFPCH